MRLPVVRSSGPLRDASDKPHFAALSQVRLPAILSGWLTPRKAVGDRLWRSDQLCLRATDGGLEQVERAVVAS